MYKHKRECVCIVYKIIKVMLMCDRISVLYGLYGNSPTGGSLSPDTHPLGSMNTLYCTVTAPFIGA